MGTVVIYKLSNKLVDILLVFMLVMSSGGMLFVFNRNISTIVFLFFLLIVLFFFGSSFKRINFNSSLFTLSSFFLLGNINYFFSLFDQTVNKYVFYFLSVFLSTLILFHFNNNRSHNIFIKTLYTVLKLIAIHATLNFFLFFLFRNNLIDVVVTKNAYETLFNIFFYSQERGIVNIYGLEFCRNQGLFWEPGILQIFLNIFFFIQAFIIKRNRKLLLWIGFLILTTYSTTGLALLLFQILFYLKRELSRNKLVIPIIISLMLPVYFIFTQNIENKIEGEKESSFQKRLFDLTQPFFIALDNPITGVGLDIYKFQEIREEFYVNSNTLSNLYSFFGVDQKIEFTDRGSSNSIMFLLAATGFPTTIILIYMFFKQTIIRERKWLWMTIIVMSVISEPLLLRPFFLLFIVSGFMQFFNRVLLHDKQLT